MPDRAVVFIDGNNWFHAIRDLGVDDRGRLNYRSISLKLLGPRTWVGTRYYIGRVPQRGDTRLYAAQRRFLAGLKSQDPRISAHLGRLEPRTVDDPAAKELQSYLSGLKVRIDSGVYHDLLRIARGHRNAEVMVEKAVDVMLAVDMVVMAERDEFDAAYLLSADGDFTPAVSAVKAHGKKVYAVSPEYGAQLAAVVDSFIRPTRDWFDDCYG
jgi:hypothetical protein